MKQQDINRLISYLEKSKDNESVVSQLKEGTIPDVELEIVSGYGGRCLGYVHCSLAIELIDEQEDKEINRDYYLTHFKD